MLLPKSILITGGAGFIGAPLAHYLSRNGYNSVTAVDNVNMQGQSEYEKLAYLRTLNYFRREQGHHNISIPIMYDTCDITNMDDVERVFSYGNYDIVIHLAAKTGVRESLTNPQEYTAVNMLGFNNVIEASRRAQVKHFIYASSSSVYGATSILPLTENQAAVHPMSLYAATKRSNEMVAHSYSWAHGMRTTGLRFFTVFGPYSRLDMAPFKFANAIINDQPIDVFNYGKNTRDYTGVFDVVEYIEYLTRSSPNNNYTTNGGSPNATILNVGNGLPVSTLDFISMLEQAIGKKAQLNLLPAQPGDMEHTEAGLASVNKNSYTKYKSPQDIESSRVNDIKQLASWVKIYQTYGKPIVPAIEMLL
jgi:UDP-glucuronate 4-epimerase